VGLKDDAVYCNFELCETRPDIFGIATILPKEPIPSSLEQVDIRERAEAIRIVETLLDKAFDRVDYYQTMRNVAITFRMDEYTFDSIAISLAKWQVTRDRLDHILESLLDDED
jgi:hypothetical protein